MADTDFTNSYFLTDAALETAIGGDKRASAIALKAAVAADQAWYCQEATRHIDALVLRGQKYDLTYTGAVANQVLEFPRIIDGRLVGDAYGNAVVPDQVKRACLEEAIAIYQAGSGGGRKQLQEEGVKQFSIGGKLSETFIDGSGNQGLQSATARRLMRRYVGAELR